MATGRKVLKWEESKRRRGSSLKFQLYLQQIELDFAEIPELPEHSE
jgi:hypothetical protein